MFYIHVNRQTDLCAHTHILDILVVVIKVVLHAFGKEMFMWRNRLTNDDQRMKRKNIKLKLSFISPRIVIISINFEAAVCIRIIFRRNDWIWTGFWPFCMLESIKLCSSFSDGVWFDTYNKPTPKWNANRSNRKRRIERENSYIICLSWLNLVGQFGRND